MTLSFATPLDLKSILSSNKISTLALLWLLLVWNIFCYPCIFNLYEATFTSILLFLYGFELLSSVFLFQPEVLSSVFQVGQASYL